MELVHIILGGVIMTNQSAQPKLSKAQGTKYATMTTKSGQIRYLHSLGWSRSEIKDKVGVIYQFVRNVLKMSVKNPVDKI